MNSVVVAASAPSALAGTPRPVGFGSAGLRGWRTLAPWLMLAVLWFAADARGMETVLLQDDTSRYPIGSKLEYLEDPGGSLTLEQVRSVQYSPRFTRSPSAVPNFGFTRSVYWLRVQVQNAHPAEPRWYLEVQYPQLDHIEVYRIGTDGAVSVMRGGDMLPFSERAVSQRTPVFEMPVPPGGRYELYIRVHTEGSLQVPAVFWSPLALLNKDHDEQLALGIYYGIILAMLVYNLLLFLSVRDTIYLYYVGYISAFVLFQLTLNGLAYEYLWPGLPVWNGHALILFLLLAILLATQFTRSLLECRQEFPRNDRAMMALMILAGIGAVASLFIGYGTMIRFATLIGLIAMVYLNLIGLASWKRGVKLAGIYMASWSMFLVGSAVYGLKTSGLAPSGFITNYSIQVGSGLEALLLSFALAYRIKLLKRENERIEHEATANLERNVAMRTEELNDALAELSRANERLENISRIDGLTGVMNRRHFDETYAKAWSSAIRGRYSLAVLLLDLDHFKVVNDTYGHLCGDEVLRRVAQTVASCLTRATDTVARYGGEEFVVLLPYTDRDGALRVAEAIRKKVESLRMLCQSNEVAAQKLRIQVSIGVDAAIPGHTQDGTSLISNADQALYEAKNAGRNRSVVYSG